ncbi:MAG: hypothetical protein RIQ60_14 [Pseudomonadota bacterium]|jgi:quinoprotein relay system zinc metallohydrolase 1
MPLQTLRRRLTLALALLMALSASLFALPARAAADLARLDYQLAARALAPGVWVVEGTNADFSPANGCNIINTGFIATGAGVLVINTGPSKRYGEQLRALITRTTPEPVIGVLHLNLHPDYFLGNQAFSDVPRWASPRTRAGMASEFKAYEDNLYRLCGDWMLGTEALLPDRDLPAAVPGRWWVGGRELELVELDGHTASDLVLVDRASQIAFVGGLVFVQRIPTTPHARVAPWLASLERLQRLASEQRWHTLVPSHGPVLTAGGAQGDGVHDAVGAGIDQTRAYLRWLDTSFSLWARQGWEMSDVLRAALPAPFRSWAAVQTEFVRNVAHLYPVYERAAMASGGPR